MGQAVILDVVVEVYASPCHPWEGRTRLRATLVPTRPYLFMAAAAALPLVLYAITGYGGQDFEFHYTLWLALHDAWAAREWFFGWSPGANYGLGEPSLCFYPPLSPFIGAVLSFLVPAHFLPASVSWLVLFTSGVSMYLAGKTLLAPHHRLPAALLYIFSPCVFLLLFLRGSIAEAWTAALLPLTSLFFFARHCMTR